MIPAAPLGYSILVALERSRTAPRLASFALLLTVLGLSSDAYAIPPALAPGTKANNFDFGPAFGVGRHGSAELGGLWLDFLHHFRGDQSGPALGAMAQFTGSPASLSVVGGIMGEWDFRLVPSKELGLYLGPHAVFGFATGRSNEVGYGAFYGMVGPTVKLSVNDFWSFWVRPANAELFAGRGIWGSYRGTLGAGITF